MKSELIIDVQPQEINIALLEDSRLVSVQKEQRDLKFAVGDIYLAKVKKLMPGLNAAFVNVGYEKDAFLHYLDLGPHFASYEQYLTQLLDDKKHLPQLPKMTLLPDIDKQGVISDRLSPGTELLVQIVKEPISSKGPRLTTEITFTGRYLVLTPFSDKISVSQKIKSNEEKMRLRQLVATLKPKNFGVIIRTSAEGKRASELNNELKALLKQWDDATHRAQNATAPQLVHEEESRIVGLLRDIFSPSFEAIHVNDQQTYTQLQDYLSIIAPDKKDIVQLYTKPVPIFDAFSVTRQIKSSFGKTVSFKQGSYIIIEHTEALHVIDVNSGNRTKSGVDQETNALDVNLRAADEIARQLRLRDMGGIIVVDFIDMAKNEHRQQLYEHMKEIMANDRARHNILPLSKFGLMQITRQRVRPVLDIAVEETCPSCHGTGHTAPSLLFTDALREKLQYVAGELKTDNFTLYVHPYVEAYLTKGWLTNIARKWKRELKARFKIIPDQSLEYLQYRVVDAQGNELHLRQEKDTASRATQKNAGHGDRTIEDAVEISEEAVQQAQKKQEAKAKKAAKAAGKPSDTSVINPTPIATIPEEKKPDEAPKPSEEKPSEKPAAKPRPKKGAEKQADKEPKQKAKPASPQKDATKPSGTSEEAPTANTEGEQQATPATGQKSNKQVKKKSKAKTAPKVKPDADNEATDTPFAPSEEKTVKPRPKRKKRPTHPVKTDDDVTNPPTEPQSPAHPQD